MAFDFSASAAARKGVFGSQSHSSMIHKRMLISTRSSSRGSDRYHHPPPRPLTICKFLDVFNLGAASISTSRVLDALELCRISLRHHEAFRLQEAPGIFLNEIIQDQTDKQLKCRAPMADPDSGPDQLLVRVSTAINCGSCSGAATIIIPAPAASGIPWLGAIIPQWTSHSHNAC